MLWTVATVTVVWLLQLQLLECSRRSALSAVSTSSLLSSSHTYEENNTSYAADVTYTGADAAKASNTATEKSATVRSDVDSSFYSRQLLVYGKSAQQKLQGGHVLLCGRGALLSETAKNLALAGVGKLTICVEERHQSALQNKERSLITNNQTLEEYARELNSQIEVVSIGADQALASAESLKQQKVTVVVSVGNSLEYNKRINNICRKARALFVASNLYGNIGYIFDDFLGNFTVTDADGEVGKEIPLLSAQPIAKDSGPPNESLMLVECIEEEKIGVGIGDTVALIVSDGRSSLDEIRATHSEYHGGEYRVVDVNSIKSCIIAVSSDEIGDIQELSTSGKLHIKKAQSRAIVKHKPLLNQLLDPQFIACNGCLSNKKDFALSISLLAAIKSIELLMNEVCTSKSLSPEAFQSVMIEELKNMNISDPLKGLKEKGQVGQDLIGKFAGVFYTGMQKSLLSTSATNNFSMDTLPQCPATVSVVGAITSQEAIKAITHIYMPVSQFMMIESLDALPDSNNPMIEESPAKNHTIKTEVELIYGDELAEELRRMKIFIVGSGAIGCELLKTFALLGIGEGSKFYSSTDTKSIDPSDIWQLAKLDHGGIVVTDMDTIERSNLNRQLLFRQQHIGMPKASVAAKEVTNINPYIAVHGMTNKLDAETEALFDGNFWEKIDLVTTALDNINARKYVDEQCIKYKKYLIDSGTLGTKGNTQVVIPGISDSYSSTADPPDDAVPLCTLKSFPYLPEHCVAWAKSIFVQHYYNDVNSISSFISRIEQGQSVDDLLEDMTSEERQLLLRTLKYFPMSPSGGLLWAIESFHSYFDSDIKQLLKEHPLEEVDEEGIPFWGGSRRIPRPIALNKDDNLQNSFLIYSAWIRCRVFGVEASVDDLRKELSRSDLIEEVQTSCAQIEEGTISEKIKEELVRVQAIHNYNDILKICSAEDFQKDDPTLGHVAVVEAAANLRCSVYSIKELDTLEVQKIAGNIIPALATTTSLVAGLVALEVIKVTSEKIRARKLQRSVINVGRKEPQKGHGNSLWNRFFSTRMTKSTMTNTDNSSTFTAARADEKERLLSKFRCAYVNVARPLIAYAQAFETAPFEVNGVLYTLWDSIEAPEEVSALTVSDLIHYLESVHRVQLQSISFADHLLFADFLPDSEEKLKQSILEILMKSFDGSEEDSILDVQNLDSKSGQEDRGAISSSKDVPTNSTDISSDGAEDQDQESNSADSAEVDDANSLGVYHPLYYLLKGKSFIDLELGCVPIEENKSDEAESSEEDYQKLPPLRVRVATSTVASLHLSSKQKPKESFLNRLTLSTRRLVGWS